MYLKDGIKSLAINMVFIIEQSLEREHHFPDRNNSSRCMVNLCLSYSPFGSFQKL